MDTVSSVWYAALKRRGVIPTEAAERETVKAFPDLSPNYALISDYIIRTYDFIANSL